MVPRFWRLKLDGVLRGSSLTLCAENVSMKAAAVVRLRGYAFGGWMGQIASPVWFPSVGATRYGDLVNFRCARPDQRQENFLVVRG